MGFSRRRLAARTLPPVTIRELRLALQVEWAAMSQQLIDTLILMMGRRCETCLAVREIISPTKDRMFLAAHPSQRYGRFKNGRTSVDNDPRSGRPSTGISSLNVERVRVAIEQDRRLTGRELEDEIRIPNSTVWRILTENLGMTRVCAKFILKLLSDQQKIFDYKSIRTIWK
ncbi:transposable element Tcb2 transposase [Trichonephila clavipes]|nr:transposable element Tcb2 transposase [Trichonephila clavipes]